MESLRNLDSELVHGMDARVTRYSVFTEASISLRICACLMLCVFWHSLLLALDIVTSCLGQSAHGDTWGYWGCYLWVLLNFQELGPPTRVGLQPACSRVRFVLFTKPSSTFIVSSDIDVSL